MTNILTAAEAAAVLRTEATDTMLLALLPQVDAYIRNASGRDWTADSSINPAAKSAARMLLVLWHEDPGVLSGSGAATLGFGLTATLTQLEALARRYHRFAGLNGAGGIALADVEIGDDVTAVIGIRGVTGDQSAQFESAITVDGYLQQTSTADLSANWYEALIVPVEAM